MAKTFPSLSLNHAVFAPPPVAMLFTILIPGMSYCSNFTLRAFSSATSASTSLTCQNAWLALDVPALFVGYRKTSPPPHSYCVTGRNGDLGIICPDHARLPVTSRIYRKVRRVLVDGSKTLVTAPYSLDYLQARIKGCKINSIVRQSWDRYGMLSESQAIRLEIQLHKLCDWTTTG